MTKTWILQTFPNRDVNQVAVYAVGDAEIVCDADWLATTTSTASTYATLSALSIATQGWQKVFDQWKADGLIS